MLHQQNEETPQATVGGKTWTELLMLYNSCMPGNMTKAQLYRFGIDYKKYNDVRRDFIQQQNVKLFQCNGWTALNSKVAKVSILFFFLFPFCMIVILQTNFFNNRKQNTFTNV